MKNSTVKQKKQKKPQGLIRQEKNEVTMEAILSHPVVVEMQDRLKTVQKMLQGLPEAIGRSVTEAMQKVPEGASGPPIPLLEAKEIQILKQNLVIDGKSYGLPKPSQSQERKIEPLSPGK